MPVCPTLLMDAQLRPQGKMSIVASIMLLASTMLFQSLKKKVVSKESWGSKLVVMLALVFFAIVVAIALHRYHSFYASIDQGLFNQVFWNATQGNWFQGSLSSANSSGVLFEGQLPSTAYFHLGQHFVITLLLWLPIYWLFPSNETLIVLQVGLITAAGLVLYALARQRVRSRLAVLIAVSYYGAVAVISPTFANFYEACQLPLFIFGILLALEKQQWLWFWLMTLLTLGVREDAGLAVFGVGAYLIVSRRFVRLGIALCSISFLAVVATTMLIMPMFSPDNSKLYLGTYFRKFVSSAEPTTLELLWEILSNPIELGKSLLLPIDRRIGYFAAHWLPLAFVPALSGAAWTISIFPLLALLLQDRASALSPSLHYTWSVVPGLFYGAILWWQNHPQFFTLRFRKFWIGCIIASLLLVVPVDKNQSFYFLLPDSISPWYFYTPIARQWQHVGEIRAVMSAIPPNASVAATTYLIPQLSSRRAVIHLPNMQFLDDRNQMMDVDYAIADLLPLQPYHKGLIPKSRFKKTVPAINQALADRKYGIVDMRDRVVLLQKGAPSNPIALANWITLQAQIENYPD
jgi:uncharacterized membrane protein